MTRLQYKQEKTVRRWACLYQSVFVMCWLPSIILGLSSISSNYQQMNFLYALYVIQAVITPLQGFFNCIIYGWRRRGFKRTLMQQRNYRSIDNSSNGHTRTL
ncbi:hypothetical protein QZH41_009725 [Actinostola sp. cb2023]|nr:hypothetical protein QZH41_009725 [Actinostola sp. cb2023]